MGFNTVDEIFQYYEYVDNPKFIEESKKIENVNKKIREEKNKKGNKDILVKANKHSPKIKQTFSHDKFLKRVHSTVKAKQLADKALKENDKLVNFDKDEMEQFKVLLTNTGVTGKTFIIVVVSDEEVIPQVDNVGRISTYPERNHNRGADHYHMNLCLYMDLRFGIEGPNDVKFNTVKQYCIDKNGFYNVVRIFNSAMIGYTQMSFKNTAQNGLDARTTYWDNTIPGLDWKIKSMTSALGQVPKKENGCKQFGNVIGELAGHDVYIDLMTQWGYFINPYRLPFACKNPFKFKLLNFTLSRMFAAANDEFSRELSVSYGHLDNMNFFNLIYSSKYKYIDKMFRLLYGVRYPGISTMEYNYGEFSLKPFSYVKNILLIKLTHHQTKFYARQKVLTNSFYKEINSLASNEKMACRFVGTTEVLMDKNREHIEASITTRLISRLLASQILDDRAVQVYRDGNTPIDAFMYVSGNGIINCHFTAQRLMFVDSIVCSHMIRSRILNVGFTSSNQALKAAMFHRSIVFSKDIILSGEHKDYTADSKSDFARLQQKAVGLFD
jgi:hypothetical protein